MKKLEFEPYEIHGQFTTALITAPEVDNACLSQIHNMVSSEMFTKPIAIMPDTHAGSGTVIGFTMPLGDKINPAVVGVDQGCGMTSFCTGRRLYRKHSTASADEQIRRVVPFGADIHERPVVNFVARFPWNSANRLAAKFTEAYNSRFGTDHQSVEFSYDWFTKKCREVGVDQARVEASVGTLGGGNHFIEIGKSEKGDDWITVHSGSRNFGKCLCDHWTDVMSGKMTKSVRRKLIDKELQNIKASVSSPSEIGPALEAFKRKLNAKASRAFLEGDEAFGYLMDLIFGQQYASFNRSTMQELIVQKLRLDVHDQIETVHNYVDFDDLIIRKGAIKGYVNERVVIPFNMEDGILICEGKSNDAWNCSLPHGAGRVGSRSWARRALNAEKAAFRMKQKGIYTTTLPTDELKGAYKKMEVIEAAIEPNATIIDRFRVVHNLKAPDVKPSWIKKKAERLARR